MQASDRPHQMGLVWNPPGSVHGESIEWGASGFCPWLLCHPGVILILSVSIRNQGASPKSEC